MAGKIRVSYPNFFYSKTAINIVAGMVKSNK
jgi:hypothetical protein